MTAESPRLLIFEDDYETMRDLKEYLEEDLGWCVELTAARNLMQRLKSERFDLLVIDLMIRPASLDAGGQSIENVHFDGINWRKTGLEFLRRLRQGEFQETPGEGTKPDVPVLILSAVADDSVADELVQDDKFGGYIEKPFRLEYLAEKMRKLIKE